jgi:hypothetical protein
MGISKELILMPERHIALGNSQVLVQSELEAQDVSMFVEIVPVLRVKSSTPNIMIPPIPGVGGSTYTVGAAGFTVALLGASHVAYRDESTLAGSRWIVLADVFPAVTSSTGGVTVGVGAAGALAKLASNPGLIACKVTNNNSAANVSAVIEVILICRGY